MSSGQSVVGMNTSATVSSSSKAESTFKVSPLVIDYHPGLPNITGIRKYQPLLHRSETMRSAVPDVPIVTFRHPPNLRKFSRER